MTTRTAATRYARALFDVAPAESLQRIESELAAFVGLLEKHPAFEKVMFNPAVPTPRKRAAVAQVVERVGVSVTLAKLLVLLAERDRFIILGELLAAFRQRLLDHQKIVRAEVTTAEELAPDRVAAIERSLAKATRRTIALTTHVDPSIIGGLVARVGSTVYDASVTHQLERIKKRLETGAGG